MDVSEAAMANVVDSVRATTSAIMKGRILDIFIERFPFRVEVVVARGGPATESEKKYSFLEGGLQAAAR